MSNRPFRIDAGQLNRMLLISCVSGAFLGVAARVTMRFVALEAGVSPAFSLGGSLEAVAFGATIGTPVALLFFGFRSQVQGWQPWVGVLCGLSLFGVLSVVPPPAARSALSATLDTPAATASAFGVLFVAWGGCWSTSLGVSRRPVRRHDSWGCLTRARSRRPPASDRPRLPRRCTTGRSIATS